MDKIEYVEWKVNTTALLKEIGENMSGKGSGVMKQPINIFGNILAEVAERCLEIRDPILDGIMCRLALYEQADQYSPEYDQEKVKATMEIYNEAKQKRNDNTGTNVLPKTDRQSRTKNKAARR